MPYQVFGARLGALDLMRAWSFLAMARSGSGISAILASRALSPSARCASALSSRARSFMASRSSAVKPLPGLLAAAVVLADFCAVFLVAMGTSWDWGCKARRGWAGGHGLF